MSHKKHKILIGAVVVTKNILPGNMIRTTEMFSRELRKKLIFSGIMGKMLNWVNIEYYTKTWFVNHVELS